MFASVIRRPLLSKISTQLIPVVSFIDLRRAPYPFPLDQENEKVCCDSGSVPGGPEGAECRSKSGFTVVPDPLSRRFFVFFYGLSGSFWKLIY